MFFCCLVGALMSSLPYSSWYLDYNSILLNHCLLSMLGADFKPFVILPVFVFVQTTKKKQEGQILKRERTGNCWSDWMFFLEMLRSLDVAHHAWKWLSWCPGTSERTCGFSGVRKNAMEKPCGLQFVKNIVDQQNKISRYHEIIN